MRNDSQQKSQTKPASSPVLKRYNYIDALRGIAILGVLLAHTGLYSAISYPGWLQNIAEISVGPRGVQLFYLISAFTLCLSLSKRKTIEKHVLRNFYIRRFFRIAPLFYLSIFYYLWQQNFWNHNPMHFSFLNIITTFTFTNGLFPNWINNIVLGGWSIAVESTFYILFPFLFYALRNARIALFVTFGTAILMQVFRLFLLSLPGVHNNPDMQTFTFQFFPSQLPLFLMGMSLFFILHDKDSFHRKNFIAKFLVFTGIFILIQEILNLKLVAGHYLYGIIFGGLTYFLSKFPIKLLVNPIIEYLGKISFSLYLCHVGCYFWLDRLGLSHYLPSNPYLNFALRFCILLVVSSAVASILYATVETGGIILGKKIINKSEKVTPTYITSTARTW